MTAHAEGVSSGSESAGWTIEEAEGLLNSLTGVLSARMVARPGGKIDEIHLLTTEEVTAKQTVRNVESALLAHLGLSVDHRKISVAQTSASEDGTGEDDETLLRSALSAPGDGRLLFIGHQVGSEKPHRVKARVVMEWNGERFTGEASGADLPRSRLELLAGAVLQTLDSIMEPARADDPDRDGVALSLDGVKMLEAFDRTYALVGVHAVHGRSVTVLSGSAPVENAPERAVILATLQATDRWVRGRL